MTVVVKLSKFHNLSHQSKRRLKGKCSLKSTKKRSRTQLKISVTVRQLLPWESNQIVYMQMRTNTFRRLDLLAQLCKSLLSGTISIVKPTIWKTYSPNDHRVLETLWFTRHHSPSRMVHNVKFPRLGFTRTKDQVTPSTQLKDNSMEPIIYRPSAHELWMETNWLLIRRLLKLVTLHQGLAAGNSHQSLGRSTLWRIWYSTIHKPKSSTI